GRALGERLAVPGGRDRPGPHGRVQRPVGRTAAVARVPAHAAHRDGAGHGGAGRRDPLAVLGREYSRTVKVTLTPRGRQGYLDGMANSPKIPVPGEDRLATLSCSFCSKDKDAIAKLVAGPGVYICNECVDLCNLIIADEPAGTFGAWDER